MADPRFIFICLSTFPTPQMDENEALKETLQASIRVKEDEIALLHQVMTETRRVFAEAMKKRPP